MEQLVTLIGNVGFPIVACIVMAMYCKYQIDTNKEEIQTIMNTHKEETAVMTEAINNNTAIITKLYERMVNNENIID